MKKQIKIYAILFLALLINSTITFAQNKTKENNNSCSIEIIGPDSIDSFTSNITYSIQSTVTGFPLPTDYIYQWSTSNNSAIEIVSGNGTPNLTINYIGGEFELNVFMIKDATSSSCCISKTITQADVPPNYTIIASHCPENNGLDGSDCQQTNQEWHFKLVDEAGNNVSDPTATWISSLPVSGTFIDNIISTSGTSMIGMHNDCYEFEVVCKLGDYYYYGAFIVPGSSETCNNSFYNGHSSGYYVRNYVAPVYEYIRINTASRNALLENGFIN